MPALVFSPQSGSSCLANRYKEGVQFGAVPRYLRKETQRSRIRISAGGCCAPSPPSALCDRALESFPDLDPSTRVLGRWASRAEDPSALFETPGGRATAKTDGRLNPSAPSLSMAGPAGAVSTHVGGGSRESATDVGGDGAEDALGMSDRGVDVTLSVLKDEGKSSSVAAGNGPQIGRRGYDATQTPLVGRLDGLQLNQDIDPPSGPKNLDAIGVVTGEPATGVDAMEPLHPGLAEEEEEKEIPFLGPNPTDMGSGNEEPLGRSMPDTGDPGASPGASSNNSKGKQKQNAVRFEAAVPDRTTVDAGPSTGSAVHDPKIGGAGWETTADRPSAKHPIRFLDEVGRTYVFPWEKAKTWEGMKRLIDVCFQHVDVIGPHVHAGRYDLTAENGIIFGDPHSPSGPSIAENSSSNNADAPPPAPPPPDNNTGGNPSASSSSSSLPSEAQTHVPVGVPVPRKDPIILPELWEDFVVPGMSIRMHMWPLSSPFQNSPPHPPPPLPPPPLINHPGFGGRGIPVVDFFAPMPGRRPGGRPRPPPPARPKTRKRPE
ncbi:kinetoplast-associated protein kap-like protein [Seiridium cupressi]